MNKVKKSDKILIKIKSDVKKWSLSWNLKEIKLKLFINSNKQWVIKISKNILMDQELKVKVK